MGEGVDRRPRLIRIGWREGERHLREVLARTDVDHPLAGERVDDAVERDTGRVFDHLREAVDVDLALQSVERTLRPAERDRCDCICGHAAEERRLVVRVCSVGRARPHRDEQPVVFRGKRRGQPVDPEIDLLLRCLLKYGAQLVGQNGHVDPYETEALVGERVETGGESLVAFDRPSLERRTVVGKVGVVLGERHPSVHLGAGRQLVALLEQRSKLLLALRPEQDDRLQLGGGDDDDLVSERGSHVLSPVEALVGQSLLDRAHKRVAHAWDPLEDAFCLLPLGRLVVGRDPREDDGVGRRKACRRGNLGSGATAAGYERGSRKERTTNARRHAMLPR